MTRLTELSQPELDVMQQLAQARVTASAVTLAADLWRVTDEWLAQDPYPLITYTLDSLSERGLVRFKVQRGVGIGGKSPNRRRTPDLPFDIRLTPKGWELMGYGNKTVEVGSRGRHERAPRRAADLTDYLTQDSATYGGPIEKQTFAEHRVSYPHHIHMYGEPVIMANTSTAAKRTEGLADPTVLGDPNGTGEKRGYIRVTPEIEARVLATRQVMGTASAYADIAEQTGLPTRTVEYILTDLPRLRRSDAGDEKAQKSLKERVFAIVEVLQPVKDVAELRRVLGMADTEHDVMHVLHSLHTQGRIDFDERGSGMGKATVINIRLPKKGSKRMRRETYEALPEIVKERLPEELVEAVEPEATTTDTPVTPPSAPEPEREEYPLLDALLERERTRQESDSKGMAFVVAAEAIQDIDPDTAATLMAKANQYNVPFPSPIEQEYIRYVANHTERKDA
jgi:hypothetical protein